MTEESIGFSLNDIHLTLVKSTLCQRIINGQIKVLNTGPRIINGFFH